MTAEITYLFMRHLEVVQILVPRFNQGEWSYELLFYVNRKKFLLNFAKIVSDTQFYWNSILGREECLQ